MTFVTIRAFENSIDAHILKSKLESEGIECYLFDDNIVSIMPFYNIIVGGIKLKINDSDLEKVNAILLEIEETPVINENNEILKCPNCGSTEVISGFKSFKSTKGILSLITSFLFAIYPIYFKTVHKCKVCDTEFR